MSKTDNDQPVLPDAGVAPTDAVEPPAPLSRPPDGVPPLNDGELAQELLRLAQGRDDVLVIANTYTVCVRHRASLDGTWELTCCGEFGPEALEAAKPLARKRLQWASVAGAPWDTDPTTLMLAKGTIGLLNRWLGESVNEAGREGDVTQAIKDELTYLTAWRCQFTGCGRDLRRHAATGSRGRFSYFAHIVAASPSGPRGDPLESRLLASELSNFMLLCDECHRLIDKVNPAKYTTAVLRKMREDNIAEVRHLLDSLQHKPAEVIAFVGNIANQPPQFSIDDAHEAMRGQRLRTIDAKPRRYFDLGGQHHDVHSAAYWGSLFQVMKQDLLELQGLLSGTRSGAARPRLAVFPLHSVSVLLLAGRILGDNEGTHLFQPHRNKVGPGTRWAWPVGDLLAPPPDKFKVEVLRDHAEGENEAILVVALTSDIAATRMPGTCAVEGKLSLPALRIVGPTFDKDCMQRPEDLQLFGRAVDAAIRVLQDDWRVRKVHLFVSAPSTATVMVGQKMQARHHAAFVCHEALPGPGSTYKATIEITSTSCRELVSGQANSHPLQP